MAKNQIINLIKDQAVLEPPLYDPENQQFLRYILGSDLKLAELLTYCLQKTADWYLDDKMWKLYQHLLEAAQRYREDMSGYLCSEYLEDTERAKAWDEEVKQREYKQWTARKKKKSRGQEPQPSKELTLVSFEYYTSAEVAEMVGIKPSTVRKYGVLLGVEYMGRSHGKQYRWTDADVERLRESAGSPKPRKPAQKPRKPSQPKKPSKP